MLTRVVFFGFFSLSAGFAQSCFVAAAGTPGIRANGQAELIGDLLLQCSGGRPVAAPNVIPATDVTLRFNVPVTSKVIAPGATEALMFFNDPAPANQHPCTIGACTNHAGVPFGPGISQNKNVFAARVGTNNREIVFVDVPVDYLSNGSTTLRMTNLRVDATALGVAQGGQGAIEVSVTSTVSGTDGSFYPLSNSTATLGIASNSISAAPLDGATMTFPTGTALNEPLTSTTNLTARYRFREIMPSAFKKRTVSNDPAIPTAQNLPGTVSQTETGFYNPSFPTAENLNFAGLANNGTRLMLLFANVPSGVSLWAPTRLTLTITGSQQQGSAQLINTDSNGAGPYSAINGLTTIANNVQVAQLTVSNGSAVAVWELTATDPTAIEEAIAGVVASYPAGTTGSGTMRVTALVAPLTTTGSGNTPRFAAPVVPAQSSLHFSNSLSVIHTPLAAAARGRAYSQQLQAAGGLAPYVWEYAGGTLPPGLSLNPNGSITGSPFSSGTFNFIARVTDGTQAIAESPFTLTVVNPPAFGAIPGATVDQAYILPAPVTATAAFALTFESGNLPPGVSYNTIARTIEGFPAQAGNFAFRMRAVDAYGFETAADLVLAVTAPTGRPLLTAPDPLSTLGIAGTSVSWQAVTGAAVYEVRVVRRDTARPQNDPAGAIVFFLPLPGQNSTSTFAALPVSPVSTNLFIFEAQVRSCSDLARTNCTPYSRRIFYSNPPWPVSNPVMSQVVTGSLVTLSWTEINTAGRYDVEVRNATRPVYRITPSAGQTSTVVSLPAGAYTWSVLACSVRCNPLTTPNSFNIVLPPVPVSAPGGTQAQVTGPNTMSVSWQPVPNADIHEVQLIQAGAGPGGGALTVASARTNQLSANLSVPSGVATALVRACNGDGCGPYAQVSGLNVPGPNPIAPVISSPLTGQSVAGPVVFFAWSRIPGDNGSNTAYRVYVQDMSRQAAALDALTTSNFYAAYLRAEGTRYDVVVLANPGTPQQVQSGAIGFTVQGASAVAPTMAAPTHMSKQPTGPTLVGWTPVPGAQFYEFYLEAAGAPPIRGVSSALTVQVPLAPVGGVPTRYNGIVRACPEGATCLPEQDGGWSPWSNQAGSGVTGFDLQP